MKCPECGSEEVCPPSHDDYRFGCWDCGHVWGDDPVRDVRMRTVLLLSGGLDSAALLWKLRAGGAAVECLAADYGQRHRKELDAAAFLAAHAGVPLTVASLPGLRPLLYSALTTDSKLPEGHYADPNMQRTVVPNRNAILLSAAAGFALTRGAEAVAYAAHAGDAHTYPDCRPEFVRAAQSLLAVCHYRPVTLLAPFLPLTKAEVVREGVAHGAPLGLTWSCYAGGAMHCGRCGACSSRREAFAQAGITDPTEYAA